MSRSTVTKTLKKDLGAIEKRLARFRMDAVLPGMGSGVGQGGRRVGSTAMRVLVCDVPPTTPTPPWLCRRAQDHASERAAAARDEGDNAGERAAGGHAGDVRPGA